MSRLHKKKTKTNTTQDKSRLNKKAEDARLEKDKGKTSRRQDRRRQD